MFSIRMDKDLLQLLGSRNVRLDELFILICLSSSDIDTLNSYLKYKSSEQRIAYLQSLERKLLVKRLGENDFFDYDNYEVTIKGATLYEECVDFVVIEELKQATLGFMAEPKEDPKFEELVDQYTELFPEGVRNLSGVYLRANKKDIGTKLKRFIKKYKHNHETIIKATENYLERYRRTNYDYCTSAQYFIEKSGNSLLATECDAVKNGDDLRESDLDKWTNDM